MSHHSDRTRPQRAAQYVRMSTDRQTLSVAFQVATNAAYALERGYQIVKTYEDAGISGLTLARREGLKQLLSDVVQGRADFEKILVYDVSRWGRFQDPDQSAHYEFLCREAGVAVEYCAELFDNDHSIATTLLKQVKRAMAAEYSRELSEKVSRARRQVCKQGNFPGGHAPFGLRRAIISRDGRVVSVLEPGQHNGARGSRVRLIQGPTEEIALVRRVFLLAARKATGPTQIARLLNAEGLRLNGKLWTCANTRRLLRCETYTGRLPTLRTRRRLGVVEPLPPQEWVEGYDPEIAIISTVEFRRAQRHFRKIKTDDRNELLEGLRRIWAKHGALNADLIDASRDTVSTSTYRAYFGSLFAAYELIDYPLNDTQRHTMRRQLHRGGARPDPRALLPEEELLRRLRALVEREGRIDGELIEMDPALPRPAALRKRFGNLAKVYELMGYTPSVRQRKGCDRTPSRQPRFRYAPSSINDLS